ncbi:Cyclic GMP-AMP synthase-like receptor 2 [Formica fusca]
MGIWKSKPVKPPNKPCKQIDENEDVELKLLRRTIARDPDSFILNNLMMCVQFFENYEEDINQIKETLASSCEAKLNKILPPQKHVLLPDILQDYIAHNIIFTSKRQTGDLIAEPLQPVRIYIVYNNIEITEQQYQPEYSSLNNGITYNMMVQSSEIPGYVRLRCLDETPYPRNFSNDDETYDESDNESVYSRNSNMMLMKKKDLQTSTFNSRYFSNLHNDETIYEDQVSLSHENIYRTSSNHIKTGSNCEHISSVENQRSHSKKTWSNSELEIRKESYQQPDSTKPVKPKVFRPPSSLSSGYDSEGSYHTVSSSAKARRNMKHNKMNAPSKTYPNSMIPPQCFKEVKINNKGNIYRIGEKTKQLQNNKQLRLRIAERQYDCKAFYTSSEMFMNHFVDFFVNQLAELLGFKPNDQNYVENSVIHCDKMIESHSHKLRRIESYEITPTIWLQWPESALEWLDRPRSTWPDYNDIGKVKDFGCYVVPENSLPNKRDLLSRHKNVKKNIHQEIEWQLTFPAAERYLETCMTRSQVQVYLIALMLHKTFLRPVLDTMHGLTTSHIRNKLFWLIEEDDRPSQWPDNRTGECLNKLLISLYRCISQNEPTMPDYFVRDKNMFSKVSCDYLLRSQKQLKRIIENPIMYVFHAMENIKHSNKFFPRLDFAKLFKILTVQLWLAVVNPAIDMPRTTEESHREEIYNRSGGFWDTARMKDQQNYSTRVITSKTLITPRKATDFIVEISERCAKLEGLRLAALLDFFVRHFIKMAECCHRYRSYHQKEVYLDQADRLSIILSDLIRYKNDAKAYRDKIHALRMKAATNSTKLPNEPPETPKRNAEPIFVSTLKDRYRPKDEQPQSSHEYMEEYTDKITKEITHEVRFKDEKNVEENIKIANVTTSEEDSYTSRKPVSKNQSDESTSDTIQRVVSLTDYLSETSI